MSMCTSYVPTAVTHIYIADIYIHEGGKQITITFVNATYTCPYSNGACEPTSYVLYAYLYCVYALVGGAICIRDPYICANQSHAVFHRSVVCRVKT